MASESNFRDLDDVFLQTQTRIWLGEVLQIRLDDQSNISDVLADGELLFEASRVVWKMLLKNNMEPRHAKAYKYEPFASRRRSGKYMPYSNVDSFLKICKILGLTGIDLFTPSDVVDKRNTRKVCMCIRSLTKKARSKHLNVPDFDIVTYTVTMSTTMVGCIRRSLERSQSSFSSSASDNSLTSSRSNSMQDNLVSVSREIYDSDSEEFDEAESNLTILQSESKILSCSKIASRQMNSNLEYLPGLASATEDYMTVQNLELHIQNNDKVENTQFTSESVEVPDVEEKCTITTSSIGNDNVSFSSTMSESVANTPGNVAVEEREKDLKLCSTDGGGFPCRETIIQDRYMPNDGENGYSVDHKEHDERKHGIVEADANAAVNTQKSKPRRKALLKSVVKGTAVISMLFIAFQLRRNGREATSYVEETNGVKLKGQKGPPEKKLNFW